MQDNYNIAERTSGSRMSFLLLRLALIIVFTWFGCMKFTAYKANRNATLIDHSPIMSWMNVVFGTRGASDVVGVIELTTAAALLAAHSSRCFSTRAAMSTITFVITLTFSATTPGVAERTTGGFAAISAPIGQFLLKDFVLLAASVSPARVGRKFRGGAKSIASFQSLTALSLRRAVICLASRYVEHDDKPPDLDQLHQFVDQAQFCAGKVRLGAVKFVAEICDGLV